MQRVEKEINTSSKKNMVKRYKMYQEEVSELLGKQKNEARKGDRK